MSIDEFNAILDGKGGEEKEHLHHRDPEHALQCRCVRYFRLQWPNHIIFAIPNGGRRDRITGAKLKAEGVVAGVPDLLVPESRHGYNCLWIEMKNGTAGRLSEAQVEMHKVLADHGNLVKVARTFDEFDAIVTEYFN